MQIQRGARPHSTPSHYHRRGLRHPQSLRLTVESGPPFEGTRQSEVAVQRGRSPPLLLGEMALEERRARGPGGQAGVAPGGVFQVGTVGRTGGGRNPGPARDWLLRLRIP